MFRNQTVEEKLNRSSMLYGLCFFVFIIIALIFITIQANNFNDFSKTEFIDCNAQGLIVVFLHFRYKINKKTKIMPRPG